MRAGDPEKKDWTSDLVLDVDFIAEWLCEVGGGARFRVAPATLVFHGVTDLRIDIDWGSSGFQCALHEVSIDRIERAPIQDQKVFRPPVLPLEHPAQLGVVRRDCLRCGWVHAHPAGSTGSDRQAISVAARTSTPGGSVRTTRRPPLDARHRRP
jgi:hypothetical protein